MITRSTLFLLFLISVSSEMYSQVKCNSSFEVIEWPSQLENRDKIKVEIKTSGDFTCELVTYSGTEKTILQTEKGNGDSQVLFLGFSEEVYYKVVVEFNNEHEFLCRKRVIDNTNLRTDN